MEIFARAVEEQSSNEGENGVPEILVQPWHGSRLDPTLEAVAHYEIVALSQFFKQPRDIPEIITAIGVSHDDVLAARSINPVHKRIAVATCLDVYDPSSHPKRDFGRSVTTAVIGHDNFTANLIILDCRTA